jgi:hypothetical protein
VLLHLGLSCSFSIPLEEIFCWCMFFISSSVLFVHELMWFGSTEFSCIVSLEFLDVAGQFQYGWNNQTYFF